MNVPTVMLAALLALMIAAALVAIRSAGTLAAIIAVGAVGFLAAIAFLLLGAPDLAIVQVAVEVIALTILIRAVAGRDRAEPDPEPERPRFVGVSVALTLTAIASVFVLRVLAEFPRFGQPVMDRVAQAPSLVYLQEGFARTGAANIVSAVLLDYRGYDTLGEATVLFCAVLGALTVARVRARRGAEPKREEKGP